MVRILWLIGIGWAWFTGIAVPTTGAEEPVRPEDRNFFETKVRPILVEHCYECHSAEAETIRGGLTLDTKAGWTNGGDSGPVIEPGQPELSPLIWAVQYDDPLLKMPPQGKLPDEAIQALTEWVRRGAPDPRTGQAATQPEERTIDIEAAKQRWPFTPLERPEPPTIANPDWARNPIDRFIAARHDAEGPQPAPEADRRTLIRRLAFDLTGLPPTPEEVDAFVNDPSADAYERLIDRLLASPHYGERWARHWLDIARFAESHGFEHDYDRPYAYHYRDFVIKALNQDMSYDQFVRWQLAGDELEPDEPLAQMATGFLAAGVHATQITASQVEKERYDELDDMLHTTGTAFLGLTIGCARCHDHKYDPIPTKDYYQLLSTLTTTVRSRVELDLDPEGYQTAKARYEAEHQPYLDALRDFERDELPDRFQRWEQQQVAQTIPDFPWTVLDLTDYQSKGGAELTEQPDGSVLASGKNPNHETYVFKAEIDDGPITAIRVEALADDSLVKGGPGRAENGNFALTDINIVARPAHGSQQPVTVKLTNPRATFEQAGLPVAAAIDNDGTSGWAVDPKFGQDHAAAFDFAEPVGFESGTKLTITLRFANNLKHSIGRPRLAVSTEPSQPGLQASAIPQAVTRALAIAPEKRSNEQTNILLNWYKTIDPEWQRLKAAEREHAETAPEPKIVKALIATEGLPAVRLHTQGPSFLEKTHFLKRGDPNQKQGVVTQSFLQVLMNKPEDHWQVEPPEDWRTSYRRASLANWITDTEHGAGDLLARVIVNRIWQHHFGRGIVATPSDFGNQGSDPTHPELLDWLATELIRNDWKLKPIHRLILTSATYRQSAAFNESNASIDPENRLLWRFEPQRLDAEIIRDAMLKVSGLLDPRMFGPGTLDEQMKRRSIYFTIKRSQLIPMMLLFDGPDALTPIADRPTTTVAPQSLYLMNNPNVREWAAAFADRVAPGTGETRSDAVEKSYRLAFGRSPSSQELSEALRFLNRQESLNQDHASGPFEAALTDFCQSLLASNEFLFVD